MSFFRSVLLLCFTILAFAFGLFALGSTLISAVYHGGYAILQTDAGVDDRLIRGLLYKGQKNFAGPPISESSQWVMLDNFSYLEKVPLDMFNARILYFDPRNDGFAQKLKNLFLRDGKRFIYVPLKTSSRTAFALDNKFSHLMGDIPFYAEYFIFGQPLRLFFFIYAASSLFLLIITLIKKNTRIYFVNIITLLPLLTAFAFFGASGFAAAAMILGFFILLKEPLNKIILRLYSKEKQNEINKNIFEPAGGEYRHHWVLAVLFGISIVSLTVFSSLNTLFMFLFLPLAFVIFCLSNRTIYHWNKGRRRFIPIQIIKRRLPDFSFAVFMLPFALAAFIAAILTPLMPASFASDRRFEHIIKEQDYLDHLAFQASFSTQRLGRPGSIWPNFIIDADGLPSVSPGDSGISPIDLSYLPPFPLKSLMEFFTSVNDGTMTVDTERGIKNYELFSLLILLLFILPFLLFKGKLALPSKIKLKGLKRLSFKPGRTDIYPKKVVLYNNRKLVNIRKDA